MRQIGLWLGVLGLLISSAALAVPEDKVEQESLIKVGEANHRKGDFGAAITAWGKTATAQFSRGDWKGYVQAVINQAEAMRSVGKATETLPLLLPILDLVEKKQDPEAKSLVRLSLAQSYFFMGDPKRSATLLNESLAQTDQFDNPRLLGLILNELGNAQSAIGEHAEAIENYEESAILAADNDDQISAVRAFINAAKTAVFMNQSGHVESYTDEALGILEQAPVSFQSAQSWVAIGKLLSDLKGGDARLKAFSILQKAYQSSEQLDHPLLISYSLGYMGRLYEKESRFKAGLEYTNKALFKALESGDPEARYLWQWQMGRLLWGQNKNNQAITFYRQAITTLAELRKDIIANPIRRHLSFRKSVGKVYYELADLLLQRAAEATDAEKIKQRELDLVDARNTIEQLKAAEIEDYYQDDCVTEFKSKRIAIDSKIDNQTAVIYPVILPDRLELLVSSADKISRVSIPVDDVTLIKTIRLFRQELENYWANNYIPHAEQLHSWLIKPIQKLLDKQNTTTLVFVPDGPLRTIPMAALYDGQQYLIEKFAIVSTPGLSLTDPRPIELANPQILLNGLSKSVQGFEALPAVEAELKAIQKLYGGKVLENEGFVSHALKTELEITPYALVHIATHGKIEPDVRDSFLLTYDGKITIDDLEDYIGFGRYRVKGLELLTLSACETAVGDDRAALGLAGIALKAGARSALATLWSISDDATSTLIPIFYRNLSQPNTSKAKALQTAQMRLIHSEKYRHPGFWAPFLLIGNWL